MIDVVRVSRGFVSFCTTCMWCCWAQQPLYRLTEHTAHAERQWHEHTAHACIRSPCVGVASEDGNSLSLLCLCCACECLRMMFFLVGGIVLPSILVVRLRLLLLSILVGYHKHMVWVSVQGCHSPPKASYAWWWQQWVSLTITMIVSPQYSTKVLISHA